MRAMSLKMKLERLALPVLSLMLALTFVTAKAAAIDSHIAAEIWRPVATAELILLGRVQFPLAEIAEAADTGDHKYVDVSVDVIELLKGDKPITAINVRLFSRLGGASLSMEDLEFIQNQAFPLFLVRSSSRTDPNYYFSDFLNISANPPRGYKSQTIRGEVLRQQAVTENWRSDSTVPHFDELAALIAAAHESADQQETAFIEIERLGMKAVPAIIQLMDDWHPLKNRAISLDNHNPNAFEDIRHYGPELMIDALAALLNQITGQSFGFIYNGASDAARRNTLAAWRVHYVTEMLESEQ